MFEAFLPGLIITIPLTLLSLGLGLLLAFLFTYLLETKLWYFNIPLKGLISFIRGVPLLIQIFLFYYGSAQFEWLKNSVFGQICEEPFACALIALTLNSAAYTTVLLQAGIKAIPKGELEACRVLHLSYFKKMVHIILKRALIIMWPSYTNEGIIILKSTALASTITLMDIVGVMRLMISKTYEPMPALLTAGALYLLLSALWIFLVKLIGTQLQAHRINIVQKTSIFT